MINYVEGDATYPVTRDGVIAHICNNKGGWGRGFVLSVSKRWKEPEQDYRIWSSGGFDQPFELGQVRFVSPLKGPFYTIANMVAQDGYYRGAKPAVKYNHLEKCLSTVADFANLNSLPVHMPRIGTGLGGGKWEVIESMIESIMGSLHVWVYDYNK